MAADCPFCSLERSRIIYESPYTYVILSNPRLMKGHTLVISKRHVERLSELSAAERKDLLDNMIKFEERILKKVASGCDVRQHYRPFQKNGRLRVGHLHVHLQPRESNDELYEKCQAFETGIFTELTGKEREEVSRLLDE